MPSLNLIDLQSAGSDALVANLLTQNFQREEVVERLWEHFPLAFPQSVAAAYERGLLAWQAAAILNSTTLGTLPNVSDIPRRAGGIGAFLYTAAVDVFDTRRGVAGTRTVQVQSPDLIDRAGVAELVNEALADLQNEQGQPTYTPVDEPTITTSDVRVVAIERVNP